MGRIGRNRFVLWRSGGYEFMNVLMIEDEPVLLDITASFFEEYGKKHGIEFNFVTMDDSVQGLFETTTKGEKYDLILLDVRLPRLTGDEIYQSLSYVNPDILERILFVTSYRDDLITRFPDTDLRILDKPYRYDRFEASISAMLQ